MHSPPSRTVPSATATTTPVAQIRPPTARFVDRAQGRHIRGLAPSVQYNGGSSTIAAGNEITSDGTWNYTYDAVGNLTNRTNITTGEEWTYGYNLNNQLVSAQQYDSAGALQMTVTYVYDAFGNLLSETDAPAVGEPSTTSWVYDVSHATAGINQQANPALLSTRRRRQRHGAVLVRLKRQHPGP